MSENDQAAQPAQFKDRTAGLVAYGSVEILIGGLCALLIPLMVFAAFIPQPGGPAVGLRMMLPAVGVYTIAAVFFIWIGVGSILARRWARAVMLICSWLWLIVGVTAMVGWIWLMPNIFDNMPPGQQVPPGFVLVMQIVMGAITGCIYLVLPLAFVLFYQSKHVWATCRFRDPKTRWTDRCPLPVLALVILFAYGAFCMLWLPFYNCVIPWFGSFLEGPSGAAVVLGVAILEVYLVWGIYHCRVAAWWTALFFVTVGSVSALLTMAQTDLMELYQRMGFPEEQLDIMRQTGMVEKMSSAWWMGIPTIVVFLGYLIYVKRYFGLPENQEQTR